MTTITAEQAQTVFDMTRETPVTFTEPPVQREARPLDIEGARSYRPVLVVEPLSGEESANAGRVMQARPSQVRDGSWYVAGYGRWWGTELNPEPVVGHYYRMIENPGCLVRFDDGDRWTIIRGRGTETWLYENDALLATPTYYFEVQYTEGGEVATAEAPATEPAATEPPIPRTHWSRAERYGLVKVEEDGSIIMNPPFVDGETYVGIRASNTNRVHMAYKVMGRDELVYGGFYSTEWGMFEASASNLSDPESVVWARATEPSVGEQWGDAKQTRMLNALTETNAQLKRDFRKLNNSLNEMAERHGWCGEYERVMESNGMRGRGTLFAGTITDIVLRFRINPDSMPEEKRVAIATAVGVPTLTLMMDASVTIPSMDVTVNSRSKDTDYIRDYINVSEIRAQAFESKAEELAALGIKSAEEITVNTFSSYETQWTEVPDPEDEPVAESAATAEVPLAG